MRTPAARFLLGQKRDDFVMSVDVKRQLGCVRCTVPPWKCWTSHLFYPEWVPQWKRDKRLVMNSKRRWQAEAVLYKFWGLFLQQWEMFQGKTVTHYKECFSDWCHNSNPLPAYFYVWRRPIREHYISSTSSQQTDWVPGRSGTGGRRFRQRAAPTGSRNAGQKHTEEKSLGRGRPTTLGRPTVLTTECRREAPAKHAAPIIFKSLGTLTFFSIASGVTFAF